MAILLKNATYIHPETLNFSKVNIYVEEGKNGNILFFNNNDNLPDINQCIDCSGKFVTKSFVVGHHHAYSALSRGMPPPAKTPENFYEILKYIWWKLDKALDKDMIEASALSTAMACAKAGTTFVIDHHASPFVIEDSLHIIAKAFDKVGINHLLCYEISDRDGLDKAESGLKETEKYLNNHQGLIGLHASFTVGDNTLKHAVDLMLKYNSGIHIHVAEDYYDEQYCFKTYNKSVIERLNEFGVLNSSKTILAHCIHLNEDERKQLALSPAWVVENMESNLNNKVGTFNAEGLSQNIMLGTDGMHSDMLRSAQYAFFAGQKTDDISYAEIYRRFRNAHKYLKENNFSGDTDNNLVVLNYDNATEMNTNNFLGHFIFGLNATHIQHVISNGKIIVKDKVITTVNEKEIFEFTKEQARKLWNKL